MDDAVYDYNLPLNEDGTLLRKYKKRFGNILTQ